MSPKNIGELFKFYDDYVKLLYGSIEAQNKLPFEVLFEINAAFDHLSRHWTYMETEQAAVEKAYSHLKRCCLDIFKLRAKKANEQYEELKKLDLSYLDNGEYEKNLIKLYYKIEAGAKEARRQEGDSRYDDEHEVGAFERWEPVYQNAVTLEKEFYLHPKLEWLKRKNMTTKWILNWKAFIVSIVASYIAGLISNDWIKESIVHYHIGWKFYIFVLLILGSILIWFHIIKGMIKKIRPH
jgi:hypothetical protein